MRAASQQSPTPRRRNSALTRLLVWQWTFQYALQHPFGGGFMAYLVDRIEYPGGRIGFARAFHSSYFEVLGEQGWIGFGLFIAIAGMTFFGLRRLTRRARRTPGLAWCADMSDALQCGLAVFMTSGAFVGIAFQPTFWYFIAISVSLREYVRRIEATQRAQTGWRASLSPTFIGDAVASRAQGPAA